MGLSRGADAPPSCTRSSLSSAGLLPKPTSARRNSSRILSIGGDQNPLTGISRTYRPRAEDGVQYPPQYRKVQITVAEILQVAQESLIRLFDMKFTREYRELLGACRRGGRRIAVAG